MGHRIAAGFLAAASLCCVLSLAGWVLDWPALRGFGFSALPIWPLTAIGYLSISAGFLLALRGHVRVAQILWCVALAIAALSLAQTLLGIDLGIDRLFFGEAVARHAAPHPGRPGFMPAAVFLLLAIAALLPRAPIWSRAETSGLLAAALLGLGGTAAILFVAYSGSNAAGFIHFGSFPGAIVTLMLAGALGAWASNFDWVNVLTHNHRDWRTLRLLLPLVLLFPVVPSLLEVWLVRSALVPHGASELVVITLNVLVVATLVYWAVLRVTSEHAAMTEVSHALESATVALTTLDGRITHWSRGCERLYGYTAAQACGARKYELLNSRCEQSWSQALPHETGADVQEMVERRADGTEICVLEHAHRVASPGREPMLVLSMTDVTRGAHAIAALRISEERLAIATAAHELGVFEWDVVAGRLEWSPGTEQRLGVPAGALGDFESWRAMIHPDDMQPILDTIAHTVANRAEHFSFRYRFVQPNGTVRAVEGSSRAFYDASGNLVRAVGVVMDITEREEREAALRARQAQLRTVLETVPSAMVVTDERGTILEFSAAAEDLWGYRAADVISEHVTMLVPEHERARYSDSLARLAESGARGAFDDLAAGSCETADGRRFPVEVRIGIARTDSNVLFTLFFRDVSDRLAAEERLSDLSAELAHVSRQNAMSELAADLAHELNQPLSATSNFLAAARMLIENNGDSERVSELLRMGSEQTLRAGDIIRRLRDFMSKREVEMRVELLDRTVRDAVELVLVGTGQFDIRVTYDLDHRARLIFADRVQVQQVLVNLLRNAMDALRAVPRPDRAITIASRKLDDQTVEIAVSDSGPGLPETVLKQLWTRFATTKDKGGMGIGLSISRRIIEAHGGTLTGENRPDGGATFRFTLPALEEVEQV